jgi:hypothetical protein
MYGITEILNSGKVGQEYRQLREQRELITEKWNQFGLLDGLEGHMAENIAQLYENQASYLINESTDATSSGSFETVAFPIIRRVFQKLLANEIVSVQAMNMPIGRLYFINPKISTRVGTTAHTTFDGVYSNAGAQNFTGTQYQQTSLYDSFYNSGSSLDDDGGLFDRTKGRITNNSVTLQVISGTVASGATGISQRVLVRLTGFSTNNAGKLTGPSGQIIDTESFLMSLKVTSTRDLNSSLASSYSIPAGRSIPFRVPMQAYGQELVGKNANGTPLDYMLLELLFDSPAAATGLYGVDSSVFYTAASPLTASTGANAVPFTATYKTYSSLEQDAEIPQVTFTFDFIDVSVEKRMLGATFTPELQQDVNAFHSIDVEAELTALLSEVVSGEIDREILRDLRKSASHVEFFDYGAYDRRIGSTTGGGLALTRKDYNQDLITKINQISARIMKFTLRGGANWVVCSPEVAAVFNDLEYFHASDASAEETKFSLGIEKVGSVANRYTVYVDAYAPSGVVLVGHKGDSIFHAGYIYAPYVPLMLMPKTINPADFKPVMGIMTRYAKKVVNNRFYGKVLVQNLPTASPAEFLLDTI